MQITRNSFSGYTGAAIYLHDTGGVRVQYNTFAASNAHAPAGSSHPYFVGEDTNPGTAPANAAPRYLLNAGYSNQDAKPWNTDPDAAKVTLSLYQCWVSVAFNRSNTPPVPYVVDVYASTDGAVPGTPVYSQTVTVSSVTGSEFRLPLDQVRGMYIRTQVTTLVDGVYQSSQFSTAALVPNVGCEAPDYSIDKQAFSDSGLTNELPDGAMVADGAQVYWLYSVTNHRTDLGENLVVRVTDDHQTAVAGGEICEVAVPPGQTVTCTWHQPVFRDGS
jgi:hypothetical protein